MDTSLRYRSFAEVEAKGNSATYQQWCTAIADDPDVLARSSVYPNPGANPIPYSAPAGTSAHPPAAWATPRLGNPTPSCRSCADGGVVGWPGKLRRIDPA